MSSVAQLLSGTGMTWGRWGSGVEETGEILCAGLREVVPPIQSLRCSKSITGVENTPQQICDLPQARQAMSSCL